jgi:hypothetical protein
MIPRTLVPRNVRPAAETAPSAPLRLTTLLDDRELIPANLPRVALDAHTSIPSHFPLDVLARRVVVPRDVPQTKFDRASVYPDHVPLTALDHRVTVPVALPVVELQPKGLVSAYELPDVLEPDVINTGEVNLMVKPVETPPRNWNWIARTGSIAAHALFLLLIVFQTKLFPYHEPTQEQIDQARQQLNFIYMPPDVRGLPRTPSPAPAPQIHVDPRVLRQITPSELQSIPAPKLPERVVRDTPPEPPPDLPVAPKPQTSTPQSAPNFLRPQEAQTQPPPAQTPPTGSLILPRVSSPGRALEQSADEALHGGGGSIQFGGRVRGGGGIGGGAGQGDLGGGLEMLTPTEGVDFNSYLARVVDSVRRNWYSVMPESVYLGEKGVVVWQFRILRDGSVPQPEPSLVRPSGKDPLDRAAASAIRTSSPFEPLPPAFSGPYIELRFSFFYNLTPPSQ